MDTYILAKLSSGGKMVYWCAGMIYSLGAENALVYDNRDKAMVDCKQFSATWAIKNYGTDSEEVDFINN